MDLCRILNDESVRPSSKNKPPLMSNDFSVIPDPALDEQLIIEPASAQAVDTASRRNDPTPNVMDVQVVPDPGDLHLHIPSEKRALEPVGPQVVDTVDMAQISEASNLKPGRWLCEACGCVYRNGLAHQETCSEREMPCKTCATVSKGMLSYRRHIQGHNVTVRAGEYTAKEVNVLLGRALSGWSCEAISNYLPGRSPKTLKKNLSRPFHVCPGCLFNSPSLDTLSSHYSDNHEGDLKTWRCPYCMESFLTVTSHICIGSKRSFDLTDTKELQTFFEMQFLVLQQIEFVPSKEMRELCPQNADMTREDISSFLARLLVLLLKEGKSIAPFNMLTRIATHSKLKSRIVDQLLQVVQALGVGAREIRVEMGDLEQYKRGRSNASKPGLDDKDLLAWYTELPKGDSDHGPDLGNPDTQGKYICLCGSFFLTREALMRHFRKERVMMIYECDADNCGGFFASLEAKRAHHNQAHE